MKRQRSTYNLSFRSVLSTVAERLCTRLAAAAHRSNRGMLTPLLTLGVSLCALSAVSRAEQYWVAWEGTEFPENEGWERIVDGVGPAVRSLSGGILTIDGQADRQIDDYYRIDRLLDPEPGELFVMQWRVRVDEVIGHPLGLYDPGLALFSDTGNELTFVLGVDFIRDYPYGAIIPFSPGMFHSFEIRSSDMENYELRVDGATIHYGSFRDQFRYSGIDWGDYTRGSASLADWDYFRFGVVPEPSSATLIVSLFIVSRLIHSRRIA